MSDNDGKQPPNAPENKQGGSRRPKSDKRQRAKITPIRWAMDEFNEAAANAQDAGLSFGAYARARMLRKGDPGPRSQRRTSLDLAMAGKLIRDENAARPTLAATAA